MGKGILLEVEGRNGVVLTRQGEFKRVPLPRQGTSEIGEEIAYEEKSGARWGWVAAAAAVLLMLLSPFGYQTWTLAQPAALVLIDINPSIELTVNGKEQVLEARGLNADGEMVLESVTWRRQYVNDVTREITAEAVAAGKLDPTSEGSAVVVAVAPLGDKKVPQAIAEAIVSHSRTAVQAEVKAQAEARGKEPKTHVAVVEATSDEVKQAREQNMTVPKAIILQEVQVSHPEVTVDEEILKRGPGQIIKGLGLNSGEIFDNAEERHNKKDDDAEPATTKGRSNKSDDTGSRESSGKKGEKGNGSGNENGNANGNGNGKGSSQDDKNSPAAKPDDDENRGKGKGKGKGSSQESRGLLHEIKVRLGIGVSDDNRDSGSNRNDAEKGNGNSGRGGQEKGDSKANEAPKGNNKP